MDNIAHRIVTCPGSTRYLTVTSPEPVWRTSIDTLPPGMHIRDIVNKVKAAKARLREHLKELSEWEDRKHYNSRKG